MPLICGTGTIKASERSSAEPGPFRAGFQVMVLAELRHNSAFPDVLEITVSLGRLLTDKRNLIAISANSLLQSSGGGGRCSGSGCVCDG